ncbi:MAG: FAD-dependent oxidoreductase [Verrucomicrobiae bacterium]|nr:FAD-dependent oxidoreductase [Verrucomicrobiae bacterium]
MVSRIAVVGAGVSGLAAALHLADAGCEVTVLEKSRGFSGRAASRTREGCRYDFGANYFKIGSNSVARLIFQTLPTEGLSRVLGDITAFNREGELLPPDPERNRHSRWTYRDGISSLGKRIAALDTFQVIREIRIRRLIEEKGTWSLESDDGTVFGAFSAVLLTPPLPQTADLLRESRFDHQARAELIADLEAVAYHPQFSALLAFEEEIRLPGDAYALINADRGHDLAWVSLENRKARRVPAGQSLLVAQLSPDWTRRHYESNPAEVVGHALAETGRLLRHDLPEPVWTDLQRWRYAHPADRVATAAMSAVAADGLYFAGDGLIGRGRVDEAMESGFAAAAAILRRIGGV